MTIFRNLFILVVLLLLIQALGCESDPPNAVGIGLLPGKDSLLIKRLDTKATLSSDTLDRVAGNSVGLLVGHSHGVEARTLLQFSIDTTLFPKARSIDSAVLRLPIGYRLVESASTPVLAVKAMSVTAAWTPATFTWDSLRSDFYGDQARALNDPIAATDTFFTMHIDTGAVRKWITTGSAAAGAGIASMILIPDTITTTLLTAIDNYSADTAAMPKFTITYHDSLDTLRVYTAVYQKGAFVANGAVPVTPPPSQLMIVQGATAIRGKLMFDVSQVPPRATITDATLDLRMDPGQSWHGTPRADTLMAQINLAADRDSIGGYSSLGTFTDTTTRQVMRFQINTMVQQWTTHRLPNNGMVLRSFDELISADRLAFFGAASADSLRPVLRIRYSLVP